MINAFTKVIKLSKLQMNAQKLTDLILKDFFGSKDCYCRKCKSHDLVKHCNYSRKITDYVNGKITDYDLKTIRLKCKSDNSTHALLIPLVIPYGRHSILVVIRAVYEYYNTKEATKISKKYQITPTTLYNWVKTFEKHKEEWLGVLTQAETDARTFAYHLFEETDYFAFIREFMQSRPDRKSFMQVHKNALNHQFV